MISCMLVVLMMLLPGFMDQASAGDKYVLLVFEGSDWCPGCIRLEKSVLNEPGFSAYLKSNNIRLVKVDFPQKKKLGRDQESENEKLARKYNFHGVFPTIMLSRTDTLVYEKIYYQNQTIKEFMDLIQDKLQNLK